MITFLPEDYQAPRTSNHYMKLQEGENKIRILSQTILGWEEWQDKKPVRYTLKDKPLKSSDPKNPVKHFWCFIVWNYVDEQIQILHITQATIRNSIEALCKDADWGAPYFYDLKIIKKGEGKDTEYLINPLPHKPLHEYVRKCFNEKRCNLQAIFSNADPFSLEWRDYTPGIFEKGDMATAVNESIISKFDADKLNAMLKECDPKYKEQLMVNLVKTVGVDSLEKLPISLFDKIKNTISRKRDEYLSKEMVPVPGF